MPKLRDCIEEAVSAGRITRQEAQEVSGQIDEYQRQLTLRGEVSPEAARTMAEQAVIDARRRDTAHKRRQATLQVIRTHQASQNVLAHPRGIVAGIQALLVKDPMRAGYSNIDNRKSAVLAHLHSHFAEGLEKLRTKNLGLSQDIELARNMVRELFGIDSKSTAAKQAARLWSETAEIARRRFNRAGGAIPKREDWGMPQWHDPVRVTRAAPRLPGLRNRFRGARDFVEGKRRWIEDITPLLDRGRMLNDAGVPMNDAEYRIMMDKMYDTIRTNGLSDLLPGRQGGTKLANRHQDHRVLAFKDAESWLTYADKYGHADIYTTLTDHLNSMASDIAKLEILGPNPEATFRYLRDLALKKGELQGVVEKSRLDSIWNVVSGKADAVSNVLFADGAAAVRAYLTSAMLGGAFLSAIADLSFLGKTTLYNGLSAVRTYRRQLSLMNPANAADRLAAVKMGLGADAWITRALAANRYVEITGAGFSAKVADFTMRASLLSLWTDAGRKAFGMEFMAVLAEQMGRNYDEFTPGLRDALSGYGITRKEWDVLRETPYLELDGARFFSVENLMNRGDLEDGVKINLATKVQEMILTETDFAVPTPDAAARAITTAGQARGTVVGELTRGASQFKSFPITVITTHLLRGARQHGLKNKAAYLGSLTIATTVMGAISMQSKDISRGRDPRDMTQKEFWTAAFIQGGGAGIFGDFVYSGVKGENRFGQSIWKTMGGPATGLTDDLVGITFGNIGRTLKGKEVNIGKDIVDLTRRYAPGSSLWYTRLAWERGVIDQLNKMADPKANSRVRRMMRKRRKEYGQGYWWRPGEAAPRRLPTQ